MVTTVGQVMVNEALPPQYQDHSRVMDKDAADAVLGEIATSNPELYKEISHKLMQLGRHASFEEGSTLRLSDLVSPVGNRLDTFKFIAQKEDEIDDSDMTASEKHEAKAALFSAAADTLAGDTYTQGLASGNPFALQVKAKARGNKGQLSALLSSPGTYANHKGEMVPLFIKRSYAEGLSPEEYWSAAHGGRVGVLCLHGDTAVCMSDNTVRAIRDIVVGDMVMAVGKDLKTYPAKVVNVFNHGLMPMGRFDFMGADHFHSRVVCTGNHKFLCSIADLTGRSIEPDKLLSVADIWDRSYNWGKDGSVVTTTRLYGTEHSRGLITEITPHIGDHEAFDIEVDHPDHMFLLANGLISSNSTKTGTAKGGYLGKLLSSAAMEVIITGDDCQTEHGIPVKPDDPDNIGGVLARKAGPFSAGTVLTKQAIAALSKQGVDEIVLRSPITCGQGKGICQQCAGKREQGGFPPIGYHLGAVAASAMAEQVAQQALNTKHGGKKHEGKGFSGFEVIKNLATAPETYPDRSAIANIDGKVEKIEPAPQGGTNIFINGEVHHALPDMDVFVKPGDEVEAGDILSNGVANPADIVRLKGLGEGRRYFADRFTKAFRDSGLGINRRNAEAISSALVNHVTIDDEDGEGDNLVGDTVNYSSWAKAYKPRPDSVDTPVQKAVGQYMDGPALHYSVGTRITPSIAKRLTKHGYTSVMSNPKPVSVTPEFKSVVKTPEFMDDWMARLGSSYLETRLIKDVQLGAESDAHSLNPIPGLAKTTEFGSPPKGSIGPY